MQVTPLYANTANVSGASWQLGTGSISSASGVPATGLGASAWDGPLAAYDAYTSFMPSVQANWWPLYDQSGAVSGNSPPSNAPPSSTPGQPSTGNPSGDPSGFWGSAPSWLQDLMLFAYNPFSALLTPQSAPLASSASLGSAGGLSASLGLADIASSYNYDNLAASSSVPSYLLENGSVVTSQGLDLMA